MTWLGVGVAFLALEFYCVVMMFRSMGRDDSEAVLRWFLGVGASYIAIMIATTAA